MAVFVVVVVVVCEGKREILKNEKISLVLVVLVLIPYSNIF